MMTIKTKIEPLGKNTEIDTTDPFYARAAKHITSDYNKFSYQYENGSGIFYVRTEVTEKDLKQLYLEYRNGMDKGFEHNKNNVNEIKPRSLHDLIYLKYKPYLFRLDGPAVRWNGSTEVLGLPGLARFGANGMLFDSINEVYAIYDFKTAKREDFIEAVKKYEEDPAKFESVFKKY